MPMLTRHRETLEFDKVLALLARHCSFSASRSLAENLEPSSEETAVRSAQDATDEARRLSEARPNTGVRGAHDVRPHVRRAAVGGMLQPTELLEVASTIAAGRSIKHVIARQEVRTPTLARAARGIAELDDLEGAIRRSLDDEGRVLDAASDRLRAIRAELRASYDRLMRRLNELMATPAVRDALQEPLITMRSGRYVLPVKSDFRGRVRGIVHDQSASGATLFIEPLPIVELANRWRQHLIEEEREIERILIELSRQVGTAQYGLSDTVDALARIDLAFAMAKLAMEMEATRPALLPIEQLAEGQPVLLLKRARHPLLRRDAVPVTIELGGAFDVLLITGPNTGGKTVALKTVGLLALMAQAGLQIPADEGSRVAVFSGVYADIGDEQSIEQSLSTFSSHVTRIVEILQVADRSSLVLLDEIGAGTDPQEGAALAQAILEHLVAHRIFSVATTHYSELKTFAYVTSRVENASVEFDPITLRPTFHLTIGLPGRSNALAIAERLAMPGEIIARARDATHPAERRADEVLGEIHHHLLAARAERSAAERARDEGERVTEQLRSRRTAMEREREAILTRAEQERAEIAAELRREAETLRRDLRGLQAERARLASIEDRIGRLRQGTSAHAPQPEIRQRIDDGGAWQPAVGDDVQVSGLGSAGVIRSLSPDSEVAEVEVAGKRVRTRTAGLTPSDRRPPRTPREAAVASGYLAAVQPRRMSAEEWAPIDSQLDLRGLTTEEARLRLDQYLNDAFMEGLQVIRVVHGKGTGAVRQAVRDLLADHPLVRTHEGADPREGGDGATVVRLAS
ncbi:MAG: endonuclease MutS2 [Chloroflexi bacterium]|nr:endonuclease MutS2 [Chloroflexota bacterium]